MLTLEQDDIVRAVVSYAREKLGLKLDASTVEVLDDDGEELESYVNMRFSVEVVADDAPVRKDGGQ